MKVNQIINEGISDIVYHFTNHKSAKNIADTGNFKLSPVFVNSAEGTKVAKKDMFFMSTARSRQGSYHRDEDDGVMFELDGRKLAQSFSGAPVNYFSHRSRNPLSPLSNKHSNEMEDRVFASTPNIPAVKFIKRIQVLVEPQTLSSYDRTTTDAVLSMWKLARSNGIPISFYSDMAALNTSNQAKELPLNIVKTFMKMHKAGSKYAPRTYPKKFKPSGTMTGTIELMRRTPVEKLSNDGKQVLDQILATVRSKANVAASLEYDSEPIANPGSGILQFFSKYMKKYNLNTYFELVDHLEELYKSESQSDNQ